MHNLTTLPIFNMLVIVKEGGERMFYAFLAGAFLANCLPHLVKGISGQTHMTPFKRVSPASLNIIWAFVNIYLVLLFLNM